MQSNNETKHFKVKGIQFIDGNHFIASIANFRLTEAKCHNRPTLKQLEFDPRYQPDYPRKDEGNSRVVLIKMNFILDDITTGTRGPAVSSEFTVLDVYDFDGDMVAVDGVAFDGEPEDGVVAVADQFNDRVFIFQVNITANYPLRLVSKKNGYLMPHGVALSKALDLMAVTCYGDNSIHIQPLSIALNDTNYSREQLG